MMYPPRTINTNTIRDSTILNRDHQESIVPVIVSIGDINTIILISRHINYIVNSEKEILTTGVENCDLKPRIIIRDILVRFNI